MLVERCSAPGAVALLMRGEPGEAAAERSIAARGAGGFESQRGESGSIAVAGGGRGGVVNALARVEGTEAEAAVGLLQYGTKKLSVEGLNPPL